MDVSFYAVKLNAEFGALFAMEFDVGNVTTSYHNWAVICSDMNTTCSLRAHLHGNSSGYSAFKI